MKNVLFIRSNPVNPDSRVEKEVQCLVKNNYRVTILAWDRDCDYSLKKEKLVINKVIIPIYRVGIKCEYGNGIKNLKYNFKFQIIIWQFIKSASNQYDIIHACDFDTAFSAFYSCNKKSTKIVYDIFDFYTDAFHIPTKIKPFILKLDQNLINKADAVIICTEERKKQIVGTSPKKLAIIHNTPPEIHDDTVKSIKVSNKNQISIAYFGILAEERMIAELLDIVSKNHQYELHIGGFGKLRNQVIKYAKKFNNIKFYGKIPYNEVLTIEKKCDIITAIYEPNNMNHKYAAPNKFYEALMLGKPLIMVNGTGMSKIVENEQIGVIINYNKESLAKGLEQLFLNQVSWDTISGKMKNLYVEKYSWELMERRLLDLYATLFLEED